MHGRHLVLPRAQRELGAVLGREGDLLRQEIAERHHEGSLDLPEVHKRVEGAALVHQDVHAAQASLARESIYLGLGAADALRAVVEGEPLRLARRLRLRVPAILHQRRRCGRGRGDGGLPIIGCWGQAAATATVATAAIAATAATAATVVTAATAAAVAANAATVARAAKRREGLRELFARVQRRGDAGLAADAAPGVAAVWGLGRRRVGHDHQLDGAAQAVRDRLRHLDVDSLADLAAAV